MGSAIELYEARKVELSYLQTVGEVLAQSHFFKDAQTAERAVAKILAGQEFGMGALEAMRAFHVIDGKVEMSADAQARLVKQSEKYDYVVNAVTNDGCSITFYLVDDWVELGTSAFTIADAERAGLLKNDSAWKTYPRNMLFARALTNGVAWFCPDAISGGRVYAPGEISGEAWVEASSSVEPVTEAPRGSVNDELDVDGKADEDEAGDVIVEDAASPASDVEDPEADGFVEPTVASDAGGEVGGSKGRDSADPPLLSSQSKQLLRHAVDLRWNDLDIAAAVDEAYPGITSISDLSQEQARALIPEWARLVKATRPTKEQKDRLKALATPQDAARRAQVMFGADHIRNVGDLTLAEAAALISDLEGGSLMETLLSWLGLGAICYAVWRAIRLWVGSIDRHQEIRSVMEGRARPPWDETVPTRRAPYDWKNE